ncbi:MAG: TRAP transporter small permease subunit [Tepidamorphaceae bacterium]|nr:TRAP transporter small permease subunit [Rhodobiaceae bacterium]
MIETLRKTIEWLLEWFLIFLMVALTFVVVISVIWRLAGESFSWYDEIASIQLSWITYYGAALAALKRRHIGFDTLLLTLSPGLRAAGLIVAEITVIGFFAIMAWTGMQVLQVLEGTYLISLTWIPVQLTQSVIPIGAVLFIICELLSLPEYWRMTMAGKSLEHAEIEEEVESEMKKAGNV